MALSLEFVARREAKTRRRAEGSALTCHLAV
jgi:hypothetical protein